MPIVAVLFLLVVGIEVFTGNLPASVLGLYLLASIVAFGVYGADKKASQDDRWRVPEKILHLLGMAGGWPGALVAMNVFQHKSRKMSFLAAFWIVAAVNVVVMVGMALPVGENLLSFLATIFRFFSRA
jgi:uncharacterized membrane protein YsdA (DUF1294 family)